MIKMEGRYVVFNNVPFKQSKYHHSQLVYSFEQRSQNWAQSVLIPVSCSHVRFRFRGFLLFHLPHLKSSARMGALQGASRV